MPLSTPARRLVPVAVVVALGASACSAPADPKQDVLHGSAPRIALTVSEASAVPDVVAATDALGLELLGGADPTANAVVSPASAMVALGMLAEGARGETAERFDAALGAAGDERTRALNALSASVAEYDGDPAAAAGDDLPDTPIVHLANQAVVSADATVRDAYLDTLSADYGAGVLRTDLGASGARDLLDAWVRTHSGGLIEHSAIEPTRDTRLVLQNATLFAARWREPFGAEATRPAPFVLADGSATEVETLNAIRSLDFATADGWSMVRIPYAGPFAAEVVLPPEGTDPTTLSPAVLATLRENATTVPVDLLLPTARFETTTDLAPALGALGLGELFTSPDLSGISPEPLALGPAVQQAVLGVDGEGTVAAAVTELAVEASAPAPMDDPVVFAADHPYLFSVVADETSWALFTAAVRDPRR